MDVYKNIVNDIKQSFLDEGNKKAARKTRAILNRYLELMLEGLFHRLKFGDRYGISFIVRIYPMAYISHNMAKFAVFSKLHPYHLFKISIGWNLLKKNSFTFKPMKKLYNKFRENVLDTPKIYDILKTHEKAII